MQVNDYVVFCQDMDTTKNGEIFSHLFFLTLFKECWQNWFFAHFKKIVTPQTTCMVVGPIKVDSCDSLLNCTTVDRSSD